MRGSPLIRALLAFLIILASGYPLWRLTRERAGAAPVPGTAVVERGVTPEKVMMMLRFTHPPERVEISHLGAEVWSADRPGLTAEAEVELAFPEEGVELVLTVRWIDEDFAGAQVELTRENGDFYSRGIFGQGEVTEVLSFL